MFWRSGIEKQGEGVESQGKWTKIKKQVDFATILF
jgi:hypothetical protein